MGNKKLAASKKKSTALKNTARIAMGNKKLAASKKKSTALKNTASHKTDQVI